jgi:Glycine rich protein
MGTFDRICCAFIAGSFAALLSACGGSSPLGITGGANNVVAQTSGSKTFDYTGAEQKFIVPPGVTEVEVVALGAAGAGSNHVQHCEPPCFGRGGRVSAMIPVTPSEALAIYVGGAGTSSGGGFNGGAGGETAYGSNSGYGGGGASDVREGGDALSDRVVVAGGGGGGGGGSSYVESSATHVHVWSGWKKATSNGLVVISWR